MINYCAGFMIDRERNEVLLIRKNRPTFQAGKWNGIGGKLELLESPVKAMVREFREETGIETEPGAWTPTIELCGEDFCVTYYRTFVSEIPEFQQMTDEVVAVHNLSHLSTLPTLDNLKWILPLSMQVNVAFPLHIWWERLDEAND